MYFAFIRRCILVIECRGIFTQRVRLPKVLSGFQTREHIAWIGGSSCIQAETNQCHLVGQQRRKTNGKSTPEFQPEPPSHKQQKYLYGPREREIIQNYERRNKRVSLSWLTVYRYIEALWTKIWGGKSVIEDNKRMSSAFQALSDNNLLSDLGGVACNNLLYMALNTKTASKPFLMELENHCALFWHSWPLYTRIHQAQLWLFLSKKYDHMFMKSEIEDFLQSVTLDPAYSRLHVVDTLLLCQVLIYHNQLSVSMKSPLSKELKSKLKDVVGVIEKRIFLDEKNEMSEINLQNVQDIILIKNLLKRNAVEMVVPMLEFLQRKWQLHCEDRKKKPTSTDEELFFKCLIGVIETINVAHVDYLSRIALLAYAGDMVKTCTSQFQLPQRAALVFRLTQKGYYNQALMDDVISSFLGDVKGAGKVADFTVITTLLHTSAAMDYSHSGFLNKVSEQLLLPSTRLEINRHPQILLPILNALLCLGANCDGLFDLLFSQKCMMGLVGNVLQNPNHAHHKVLPVHLNRVCGLLEVEGIVRHAVRIPSEIYDMSVMKEAISSPNIMDSIELNVNTILLTAIQKIFDYTNKARLVTLPYLKSCHVEFCLDGDGNPLDLLAAGVPSLVDLNGRVKMGAKAKMAEKNRRVAVILEKEEHFFVNKSGVDGRVLLNGWEKRHRRHLSLLGYHHVVTVPADAVLDQREQLLSFLRQEFQKIPCMKL
ncbi:uncharacterized protein LOC106154132 [Lingula anatina]|uniref:Uncharacterized protein LOC106154132 n=1 Tax=Lingula anatina TaxID=7574 RepID=A0A1S3HCS9_LINAN|nr:uncharacterized protein LOC106154132 [Lingula anatina]|eukprot:XP_013383852.1 uncharacterized protein LOC106154132 [Lingula anatina]